MGKKPVKCALACWPNSGRLHTSKLAHLRDEGAGVFIHQLLAVIVEGCSQFLHFQPVAGKAGFWVLEKSLRQRDVMAV